MPQPICDFCSGDKPVWSYPATSFPWVVSGSKGAWAACECCHDLIEAGDRKGLTRRSLIELIHAHPEMEPHAEELREVSASLHALFFQNRTGPAIRYTDDAVSVEGERISMEGELI